MLAVKRDCSKTLCLPSRESIPGSLQNQGASGAPLHNSLIVLIYYTSDLSVILVSISRVEC